MCGRFALTLPTDAVAGWFDAMVHKEITAAQYNICPTQMVPVVALHEGERHLTQMRWGFTPHWYKSFADGPLLINARGETILEKPSFRSAFETRRCIIPATGFYEWQKDEEGKKIPYYIHPKDNSPLAFGGIWQGWTDQNSVRHVTCGIVTTTAGDGMKDIHHREPVALTYETYGSWLHDPAHVVQNSISHSPRDYFSAYRVSVAVNKAGNGDVSLIEPFDE